MSKVKNSSSDIELNFIHHNIVDMKMRIIAQLYLLTLLTKNGSSFFIHNNICLELNLNLIVKALEANIKKICIENWGEKDGLNKSYILLNDMYNEINGEAKELTEYGYELLNLIFIKVINRFKHIENFPEQITTLH